MPKKTHPALQNPELTTRSAEPPKYNPDLFPSFTQLRARFLALFLMLPEDLVPERHIRNRTPISKFIDDGNKLIVEKLKIPIEDRTHRFSDGCDMKHCNFPSDDLPPSDEYRLEFNIRPKRDLIEPQG